MFDAGTLSATLGGLMIGAAAALLFWLNGRIAGVSGIFGDLLFRHLQGQWPWRVAFLIGLMLGFLAIRALRPDLGQMNLQTGPLGLVFAGLLVGYGTRLGNGCTSGHGICGIARLSPRSFAATGTFMLVAIFTVALLRHSSLFA